MQIRYSPVRIRPRPFRLRHVRRSAELPFSATAAQRTATVVTRALVDKDDPGFTKPTKPIGRHLTDAEAAVLVKRGETWEDRGAKGWRRVVASPEPLADVKQ